MSNIKKSIEESIKRGLDVVNTPEVILSNLEYLLIQVAESLSTDNNTVLYDVKDILINTKTVIEMYRHSLDKNDESIIEKLDKIIVGPIQDLIQSVQKTDKYELWPTWNDLVITFETIQHLKDSKLIDIISSKTKDYLHAMDCYIPSRNYAYCNRIKMAINTIIIDLTINLLDALETRRNELWTMRLKEFVEFSGLDYHKLEKDIKHSVAIVNITIINGRLHFVQEGRKDS